MPALCAACCWLLAAGCWLLATGCLLLAAGCWLLAACCLLLASSPVPTHLITYGSVLVPSQVRTLERLYRGEGGGGQGGGEVGKGQGATSDARKRGEGRGEDFAEGKKVRKEELLVLSLLQVRKREIYQIYM